MPACTGEGNCANGSLPMARAGNSWVLEWACQNKSIRFVRTRSNHQSPAFACWKGGNPDSMMNRMTPLLHCSAHPEGEIHMLGRKQYLQLQFTTLVKLRTPFPDQKWKLKHSRLRYSRYLLGSHCITPDSRSPAPCTQLYRRRCAAAQTHR